MPKVRASCFAFHVLAEAILSSAIVPDEKKSVAESPACAVAAVVALKALPVVSWFQVGTVPVNPV